MNTLLLGGTTEASDLAARFADAPHVTATLSLAGRTAAPKLAPIATRMGGFGGVEGLIRYLQENAVDAVIDATHPFAAEISRNAIAACLAACVPLIAIERPPWRPAAEDRWLNVASIADGVTAIGASPKRVFCAIGRLSLPALLAAPQHHYVIRLIDAPAEPLRLPHLTTITARGPFAAAADVALLRAHAIDFVFTKNSGGTATISKIEAARQLALSVIMVARPALPPRETVASAAEAWSKLLALHGPPADLGV